MLESQHGSEKELIVNKERNGRERLMLLAGNTEQLKNLVVTRALSQMASRFTEAYLAVSQGRRRKHVRLYVNSS